MLLGFGLEGLTTHWATHLWVCLSGRTGFAGILSYFQQRECDEVYVGEQEAMYGQDSMPWGHVAIMEP